MCPQTSDPHPAGFLTKLTAHLKTTSMLPFNQSQMFKAVRVQVPIKDIVQLSEEQIVVVFFWKMDYPLTQ